MLQMVSIVILNWNGKHYLERCLSSLKKVSYKPLEIIVVDNASSDGSVDYVKKKFPTVSILVNRQNYGFAKGNNIGFEKSKGKYILILNNDTVVTPNFLEPLVEVFNKNSGVGCIQPQIRLIKDKNILDGVGAFLTSTGFLYHFGYLKDASSPRYNKQVKIFSAKGACMLLRREVIEKVGLFDEDFFIFFEETDVCFRMWLAGYTVVYEPKSVIYHIGGGDTTSSHSYQYERRMYLSFRNMICSYIKNFGTRNLFTILPIFLTLQLGLLFYYLCTFRFNLVKVIIRAFFWNILHRGSTLRKRKTIQHRIRKLDDREVNKQIIQNRGIFYYYALLSGNLGTYQE